MSSKRERQDRVKHLLLAAFCAFAAAGQALAQNPQTPLADLIQAGDRKAALEIIRTGGNVNQAQPDGTRPVHWAVYRADHELLEALIAKKARVDVTNEFGSTPIAEAAKLADLNMVKMLLNAGAGPEGANQDGENALMLAIRTGELPVVEALINAGADVNVVEKFHNQTPLMYAAAATRNAGPMVGLLLGKGANFKARALYSDWPSQITSEPRAQYRPVGGLTPLLYAARNGCSGCVEALMAAGADVNLPTPEGVTPLMIALDNAYNDVAKLLFDHGANPHLWDWWGRTALYLAVDRKTPGAVGGTGGGSTAGRAAAAITTTRRSGDSNGVSNLDIINALLAAGVDPSPQLNMHRPSRGGNSGRFIDPLLNTGCTPLLRAVIGNDVDVVQALLAKGASPNINDMGLTSFLVAAGVGTGGGGTGFAAATGGGGQPNLPLMELLLQHGADVNAQVTGTKTYSMRISRASSENEGMTALHVAAQRGRTDIVRFLLDKGADPGLVDSNGRKPIDLVGRGAQVAGSSGQPGGGNAEAIAEIRALLQGAATKK